MFICLVYFPISVGRVWFSILHLHHLMNLFILLAGYCAFLDVENALDLSLAESIGVNTERLLISHPDCAENLLSMVNTLAKSGAVDVIVIDSVSDCFQCQPLYVLMIWQGGEASYKALLGSTLVVEC